MEAGSGSTLRYAVTEYKGSDTDIVIPAYINGNRISGVGYNSVAVKGLSTVKSVKVEYGILSLYKNAFDGYGNLERIELSDFLTGISAYSMRNTGITTLRLPDKLINIDSSAFDGCNALESISAGPDCKNYKVVDDSCIYTITGEVLRYVLPKCSSIDFPDTVKTISADSIVNTEITSLVLPEGFLTIKALAISRNAKLESVVLPESVTTIESNNFANCSNLKSFVIQSKNATLGTECFAGVHAEFKIFVPEDAVDYYKAAANWSSFADKIFAISE